MGYDVDGATCSEMFAILFVFVTWRKAIESTLARRFVQNNVRINSGPLRWWLSTSGTVIGSHKTVVEETEQPVPAS